MFHIRILFILVCLSLVGCNNENSSDSTDSKSTPVAQGPLVISHNPNAIVKTWEYLGPHSDKAPQSFPSQDPKAIAFGPNHYEAYMIWHEGGFDIIWGNYFCSTQPILTIREATISLWLNDGIWDDCEASQEIHVFNVELETNIPPEEWTYILHQDAPEDLKDKE